MLPCVYFYQSNLLSLGVRQGPDNFLTWLLHSKPQILEAAYPLHNPESQQKLWKRIKANIITCPLQEIRDYFGKHVRSAAYNRGIARIFQGGGLQKSKKQC